MVSLKEETKHFYIYDKNNSSPQKRKKSQMWAQPS